MLWDRKRFKKKANRAIGKNYMYTVAVCFLVAFIANEGSSSLKLIKHYDETTQSATNTVNQIKTYSKRGAIEDLIRDLDLEQYKIDDEVEVDPYVEADLELEPEDLSIAMIEAVVSDNGLLFRFYESNKNFVIEHQKIIGAAIAMGSLILILFEIFIGNVMIVGKRRFFLENRIQKGYKTPIRTVLYSFEKGIYLKTVKIMFLKQLYTFLWSLTIVGGLIKVYEYRAIPFILASNTQMTTKEIFKLSKSIMKGYKWKTFVLDVTFIPWKILQWATLGIAGVFYVLPYMAATRAEAYIAIRNEALAIKKPYFECIRNPLFYENVEEYINK